MENYGTSKGYGGYNYPTRQNEEEFVSHAQPTASNPNPAVKFQGWGFSKHVQQYDSGYKGFGGQSLNAAKNSLNEEKKEDDDFERSVHLGSESDFGHRNINYPNNFGRSNYDEIEKMPNIPSHNSFILNDDRANSIVSHAENKGSFHGANIMSLAKPISNMNDYALVVFDLYTKTISVQIIDEQRGERNAELIVKIRKQIDQNTQKMSFLLELTEEENPLFLYSKEIDDSEFQLIRRNQGIHIEFHKFAEYCIVLFDNLNGFLSMGSTSNEHQYCTFKTNLNNHAQFLIQKRDMYRINNQLDLIFNEAAEETKLKFLSKQVKEFKNLSAKMTEERNSKIAEVDDLSNKLHQIGKFVIYNLNRKILFEYKY